MTRPTSSPLAPRATAFGIDVLIVVIFAAGGRASHNQDLISGLWRTLWPFLLALVVGWVVSVAWKSPLAPLRTGLPVGVITVAGGLLLRWAGGQRPSLTFLMVTTAMLAGLMVGWRVVTALFMRNR